MEIKIIDDAGVKYALEFDLKKVGAEVAFHEITATIKQSFKRQIEKLIEFVPNIGETVIKVNLEQARENDIDQSISTALACFDGERSSENEYFFRLYYSTIKEIALNKIGEQASFSVSSDFENTILHELIHAVDLTIIKETQSLYTQDFRLGKRQSDFMTTKSDDKLFKTDIQWAFLNTIVMFRNEGITVLGEKLLGDSPIKPLFETEKETLAYFRNLLSNLGQLSTGVHFASNIQQHNAYDKIRQQSMMSYYIGDLVLIKLIENLEPALVGLCAKTSLYLLGNSSEKPTADETRLLLSYAFQMDLSDYLNALINCHFDDIEGSILVKENVLQLCALIQDDRNQEGIEIFSKNIAIAGFNNSKDQFIQVMEDSVYTLMSKEELVSRYENFIKSDSSEDIVESIKQRAAYLFPLAIENENEIAQWALTYLFDEEDLIFDNLSVFGWQDDWLVLDAAVKLLGK